ncbi:hypothetical protein ES703_86687 [subsurface metagenome]
MRLPKRGERGFTLIELLIVVAILGVLAAVVIPNVSRFIGRGEGEAKDTELSNIQSAVTAMMVDNELPTLPAPVATDNQTNLMSEFPDYSPTADDGAGLKSIDIDGNKYHAADKDGYILYQHDMKANSDSTTPLVNYVASNTTAYWYSVDAYGTVTQHDIVGPNRP